MVSCCHCLTREEGNKKKKVKVAAGILENSKDGDALNFKSGDPRDQDFRNDACYCGIEVQVYS